MRAALLLLAGCNIAFGLEHQDPLPIDAAPPEPRTISASVSENYLIVDQAGLPGITNRIPLPNVLSIFVADRESGLRTQVPFDAATGTFAITAPADAPTRIQLVFAGQIYEWQWDDAVLAIQFDENARIGQVPASATTTANGTAPSATIGVFASGVWSTQVPKINLATWSVSPWTGGLPSGVANDRVFVTAYTAVGPDLVLTKSTPPINLEMQAGKANPITNAYTAVAQDHCFSATTHLAEDNARIGARFPNLPVKASDAIVYAVPEPTLGTTIAWLLMHTSDNVPTVDAMFGNPFPGFTPIISTFSQRSLTEEGVSLQNYVFHFETEIPCGSSRELPANKIGIPANGVFAGVALTEDNNHVALADKTTTFTWDVDGPDDLFLIQWYDLGAGMYTGRQIQSRHPSIVVDTSDFIAGHHYTIAVTALSGLPSISAGDVSTFAYPHERSTTFFPEVTID